MQRNRQTDPDLTPICDASEALLAAEALAAASSTDFSDFSEDAEPTRAMMRDDIPNEPMLLERRASKARDSEDPVYPEAAVPEIVDFAERMSSEPPAQIVPAPRVSKFVAQPTPEAMLPPARQAPPPAKPLPPPNAKQSKPVPMFPESEPARPEDGSLASATVEAPTPPPPRAEIVAVPTTTPARPSRPDRARSERSQQGALVFLGVCALAATGLIGVSVGRSSVPTATPQQNPAAAAPQSPPQTTPQAVVPAPVVATVVAPAGAGQDDRKATSKVAVAPAADKAEKAGKDGATPTTIVPEDGVVAPAFDSAAATAALSGLSASVQSCGDNAGGTARVAVTFAPSGRVTQAVVEGAPYAGTPAGGCIAAKARAASIPAFSGAPVTVRKSYTMN